MTALDSTGIRGPSTRTAVWLTAFLAAGASVLLGWMALALKTDDIEASESPLLLAAASQRTLGPENLYGPYGSKNPYVLIHAPLYYRLTFLAAWLASPMLRDPVSATLVTGRLLSALSFVVVLGATYGLASIGPHSRHAGIWAVLVAAGTPVWSGLPFEVRPDILGLAFQTVGIWLVVSALAKPSAASSRLFAAFVAFALAVCVKQQYVIAAGVSLALMFWAWIHRRMAFSVIGGCLALALAIVSGYYGFEQWFTSGQLTHSVFSAARHVMEVHPADDFFALNLTLALIWKCVGPILLIGAASAAMAAGKTGYAPSIFVRASTLLIGLITALTIMQVFVARAWLGGVIAAGLVLVIAIVIPICGIIERDAIGCWPDGVFGVFCSCELLFAISLWSLSTGGWFNYALEAVVLVSVLAGRAVARACERSASSAARLPLLIAALALPAYALTDLRQVVLKRDSESREARSVVSTAGCAASAILFVDLPGMNRLNGRRDLVIDPWLYPVFEATGLTEPRSVWIEQRLRDGSIHAVATTAPGDKIDGVTRSLPELGFRIVRRAGRYRVWLRARAKAFSIYRWVCPPVVGGAGTVELVNGGHIPHL